MKKFVLFLFIFAVLIISPFLWVRMARPARTAVSHQLAQGTTYQRIILEEPDVVAHVVTVDLTQTAVSFQVTPTDTQGSFAPLKTTAFLRQFNEQIAINGSFYQEDRATGALTPIGQVIADGQLLVNGRSRYPTLCISSDQQISISNNQACAANSQQGIAGNVLVVENGEPLNSRLARYPGRANAFQPQPRTAVALNEAETTLWLVVIDGRQPNYSVGMTMDTLAAFLVDLGAHTALNLDGGGSSTLVTQSWRGPVIRNSPIHNGIPTLQRPVPTHLGLSLEPVGSINAE